MDSSPEKSAHRALLELERSTTLPTELLDEAARILGVKFGDLKDELFSEPKASVARKLIVFAAKEEWTLRWLLKKTKPGARTTRPGSKRDACANDDPRKWLLFYYLVQKVPVKKVAKTLREQEVMQQIRDALIYPNKLQETLTLRSPSPQVQTSILSQ